MDGNLSLVCERILNDEVYQEFNKLKSRIIGLEQPRYLYNHALKEYEIIISARTKGLIDSINTCIEHRISQIENFYK